MTQQMTLTEAPDQRNAAAQAVACSDLLAAPVQPEEKRIGFAHDRDLENGKEEWLTPPEIFRALGDFDLDPCAPINRPWPTAKQHYTITDNGLLKEWRGRVWCNPPYGPKTGEWMRRCAEHKNCTALIFARTETQQFFAYIWPRATAVCFLKGRLSFYHVNGTKGGTAGAPSMLVAWDDDNANAIWDAIENLRIKGAFVDLRGGQVTLDSRHAANKAISKAARTT